MAVIIDGIKLSEKIQLELKERVDILKKQNIKPQITVIRVGRNPASIIYIKYKRAACEKIGIKFNEIILNENIEEKELIQVIEEQNKNNAIHGILVQFPLPDHIDQIKIMNAIKPEKDVDGLNEKNNQKLIQGKGVLVPCTPKGIMRIFTEYNINLKNKEVVVIGRSKIVGAPMATMLRNAGANVIVCHTETKDIPSETRRADIVIVAAGSPLLLKEDMVKEGVVVVDVGITRIDNKIIGDVDYKKIKDKSKYITPNPGGVGPMTITMLLSNLILACENKDH